MKILIVEDDPDLRADTALSLQSEGYLVETAEDFHSANEKIGLYTYDCILLDLGLPGGDGIRLLQEMKKEGVASGVIIISARGSLDDKINGLNEGADDYLPKPFHMAELHARITSILRRRIQGGQPLLEAGNLSIDTVQRTLAINGNPVALNRKEFDVLLYLVINRNRLVHKTALAEHVWGDYIDDVNSFDFIYSQIKNLRKKLKDHRADVEINAIYGIGYKLSDA